MPRAHDVPTDTGDKHPEPYEGPTNPEDDEAAALAEFDGQELQQRMADEADNEPLLKLSSDHRTVHRKTPRSRSSLLHSDQAIMSNEAESKDSLGSTGDVIAESLRETGKAARQWSLEKSFEYMADAVHPGAGRLINIFFTIKEVIGGTQALVSPDSPRNLRVPLFQVAGGLVVDLNIHLPGSDRSGDDAPPVTGFLSPGDGGLFGGWAIEADQPADSGKEASAPGPDARPQAPEQVALPSAEQAEQPRDQEPPASPIIENDLTLVEWQVQSPWRRAVVLREAASRLRDRLYARAEFSAEPLLVIYDPLAGLGMWLVKPGLASGLAGRHIVIQLNPVTGVMAVFIR